MDQSLGKVECESTCGRDSGSWRCVLRAICGFGLRRPDAYTAENGRVGNEMGGSYALESLMCLRTGQVIL
jgi:hypothetical protein